MLKEKIKRIFTIHQMLPLDQRVTNEVMIVLAIVAMLSGYINSLLNFVWWYPFIFYFSGLLALVTVIINFYKPGNKFIKPVFLVVVYIIAILGWPFNAGINGPDSIFLFAIFIFSIGVFNKKFFLFFLLNFTIFAALAIYSYLNPSFIQFRYSSEAERLADSLYSYFLLGIAIVYILKTLIVSYITANKASLDRKLQLESLNNQLQLRNEELIEANKQLKEAKEAVQENEEQLNKIIESTDGFIWTVDPEKFGLLTFNSALSKYYRESENKIIRVGDTPEVLAPLRVSEWEELYGKALEMGKYETEYRRTGESHHLEISLYKLTRNGNVFGISAFGKDITKSKQIQTELKIAKERAEESERDLLMHNAEYEAINEELRETNEKLFKAKQEIENFFSYTIDLLCIAGMDGRFLHLNNEWENLLGYSKSELKGCRFIDLVHPDDQEFTLTIMDQLAKNKDVTNHTNRYLCKDGTFRWLEWRSHPYGDEIFATARDITERIRIQNELIKAKDQAEENEKQFRQLFENMEQGFALHEMLFDSDDKPVDYRFYLINKAFEQLTGIKASEFIGHTVKELLPNIEQTWLDNYGKVAITGIPLHFEDYSHELGKYYEVTAYSPKKNFFAVVFNDITKNKLFEKDLIEAKEKAEESDRLKSSFLQNISHEVRTPLNAIAGFSELMTRPGQKPEKLRSYSGIIHESTDKLISIITDVIEISHIHSNQLKINFQKTEIVPLLTHVVSTFESRATAKGLLLNLKTVPEQEIMITTDKDKLARMLGHLIDNAIKFTRKGFIEVACIIEPEKLKIAVTDTGIGIPEEMHKIIFEPFRQVETQISKTSGGNGLGLALTFAYCQLLNYKISLTSDTDKGSCFTLELPHKVLLEK